MTTIPNNTGYLNTQQLMDLSENIVGITKDSNPSIFSDVKSLDENKNQGIETSEAGIAKLVSLGKKVLNKLATLFGINMNVQADSQPLETYEDTKNEPIVEKYFKPIIDKTLNASETDVKEGSLDNMVSQKQLKYTLDAIIVEKAAGGIQVINSSKENGQKTINFSDGSKIIYSKGELSYVSGYTNDKSQIEARLTSFGENDFSAQEIGYKVSNGDILEKGFVSNASYNSLSADSSYKKFAIGSQTEHERVEDGSWTTMVEKVNITRIFGKNKIEE